MSLSMTWSLIIRISATSFLSALRMAGIATAGHSTDLARDRSLTGAFPVRRGRLPPNGCCFKESLMLPIALCALTPRKRKPRRVGVPAEVTPEAAIRAAAQAKSTDSDRELKNRPDVKS